MKLSLKALKDLVINIIINLSRFRITNYFFTFPFEYWLVNLLRKTKPFFSKPANS